MLHKRKSGEFISTTVSLCVPVNTLGSSFGRWGARLCRPRCIFLARILAMHTIMPTAPESVKTINYHRE